MTHSRFFFALILSTALAAPALAFDGNQSTLAPDENIRTLKRRETPVETPATASMNLPHVSYMPSAPLAPEYEKKPLQKSVKKPKKPAVKKEAKKTSTVETKEPIRDLTPPAPPPPPAGAVPPSPEPAVSAVPPPPPSAAVPPPPPSAAVPPPPPSAAVPPPTSEPALNAPLVNPQPAPPPLPETGPKIFPPPTPVAPPSPAQSGEAPAIAVMPEKTPANPVELSPLPPDEKSQIIAPVNNPTKPADEALAKVLNAKPEETKSSVKQEGEKVPLNKEGIGKAAPVGKVKVEKELAAPEAEPAAPPPPSTEAPAQPPAIAQGEKPLLQISFKSTETSVPLTVKPQLDNIVSTLKTEANMHVMLMAYASAVGDQTSMARRVSLARALAVRTYLLEQGIDKMRVNVDALGEKNPGGEPDRVDVFLKNNEGK